MRCESALTSSKLFQRSTYALPSSHFSRMDQQSQKHVPRLLTNPHVLVQRSLRCTHKAYTANAYTYSFHVKLEFAIEYWNITKLICTLFDYLIVRYMIVLLSCHYCQWNWEAGRPTARSNLFMMASFRERLGRRLGVHWHHGWAPVVPWFQDASERLFVMAPTLPWLQRCFGDGLVA